MFLTLEQVAELTREQCLAHLNELEKTYPFENPITPEVWAILDDITNTLLYLEDHIRYLSASDNARAANLVRWADKE